MIKLDGKSARTFKIVLISVMGLLLIADIYFLSSVKHPTISKVALYSSPRYLVLIWLFGFFTTHFFFPRVLPPKPDKLIERKSSFLWSILMGVALLIIGFLVSKPTDCNELGFPEFRNTSFFMEATCRDFANNSRVSCDNLICKERGEDTPMEYFTEKKYQLTNNEGGDFMVKYDLTPEMKFLLLILGFFWGYYIWPQKKSKNNSIVANI